MCEGVFANRFPGETDTNFTPINIDRTEYCLIIAALSCLDLTPISPSPSQGQRGIAGSKNNSLSSYQKKYYSVIKQCC